VAHSHEDQRKSTNLSPSGKYQPCFRSIKFTILHSVGTDDEILNRGVELFLIRPGQWTLQRFHLCIGNQSPHGRREGPALDGASLEDTRRRPLERKSPGHPGHPIDQEPISRAAFYAIYSIAQKTRIFCRKAMTIIARWDAPESSLRRLDGNTAVG
jgi:hypothetical protein